MPMRSLGLSSRSPKAMRARALVLLLVSIACETTAPDRVLQVSVPATAGELSQGQSKSVAVAVTASGLDGSPSLQVTGLPIGVTAVIDRKSDGNATVTLTASPKATPGEAMLTVAASAIGVNQARATFTLTVLVSGTYSLGAPAPLTGIQGGSATATIPVARQGGFAQDVAFAVTVLQSGVTAVVDPNAITDSSANVTFTIGGSAPVGTYDVTITGTSPGLAPTTTTMKLSVTLAFTLSATKALVFTGASATSAVTILRNGGFAKNVDLTVTGLPNGVTATFGPPSAGGASSVLTFTASSSAPTGSAVVTVHGVSGGLAEQTATLAFSVHTPTPISIDFCTSPEANTLQWAAFQNEGADWMQLTPDANGTVSFTATEKVAFASVTGLSGSTLPFETRIKYLTASELKTLGGITCQDIPTLTVNRTETAIGLTNSGLHLMLWARLEPFLFSGSLMSPRTRTSSWTAAPSDVVALRESPGTPSANSGVWDADLVAIRRSVDLSVAQTFDVTSGEFLAPTMIPYAVTGLAASDTITASLNFITHAFADEVMPTRALVWSPRTAGIATGSIPAIPASLLLNTDLHQFGFTASQTVGSDIMRRTVSSTFKDPVSQNHALGAPPTKPTFTELSSTGLVRYRAQFASHPDYGSRITFRVSNTGGNFITIESSAAYAGGTPATWDVSIPDLTSIAGWSSKWNVEFGRVGALEVDAFSSIPFDVLDRRQEWVPGVVRWATWRTINIVH
jgi:hypothetical protein